VSFDKTLPLLSEQTTEQRLFLLSCNFIDFHGFGILKVLELAF